MQHPSIKRLAVGLLVVSGVVSGGSAYALDLDALRARLEQSKVDREARLSELRSDLGLPTGGEEQEGNQNSDVELDESTEEPAGPCECKARLSLAKPEVRWTAEGLVFVPKFDVDVRVRDERPDERWNLRLDWAALSEFQPGEGVTAPSNQALGGSHTWGGACMNTKLSFDGHQEDTMSLGQLLRSAFVEDTELEGKVTERARLTGCDTEEAHRQFKIKVNEFGNLRLGSWQSAR